MMRVEAGFYHPIDSHAPSYGKSAGFALLLPRRKGLGGFRVVTGTYPKYKSLNDFFFKVARRHRMPASQIARIPMMAELQISASGKRHMLIYRGVGNWRSYRNKFEQELAGGKDVIWHDRET